MGASISESDSGYEEVTDVLVEQAERTRLEDVAALSA